MAIALIVIDDDALVRAGLALLLGGADDIEIVAEGADGDEAVYLVGEHRPDVVLMDIRMARMDGLTATEEVLALDQPPKVIILTTFDADDMVMRALAAGAHGFLLKDTPPARMVEAIRQVAAGEHTLSPSVIAQVIEAATGGGHSVRDEARARLAVLATRERAVARAIAAGQTNAEIAAGQFMSLSAVKATITRILDKLGCVNRVQVALIVHDAAWD